ncbi:MAG: hypothetical protein ACJ71P_16855, partial [Nitrososphaeraceae archaeon]
MTNNVNLYSRSSTYHHHNHNYNNGDRQQQHDDKHKGKDKEEIHIQWKQQGTFSQGIAIILGRVWHREDKRDQYFTFLDADKHKAIDELSSRNGKTITLQEMAHKKFLIEQHKDNLEKAHIYFYSPVPFPRLLYYRGNVRESKQAIRGNGVS